MDRIRTGALRTFVRRYFFLLFIAVMAGLAVAAGVRPRDIWAAVSGLRLWQLGVLIGGYLLIAAVSIANRRALLAALGYRVRLGLLSLIHFTSMAAHYSTPAKIGFPLTVYLLRRSGAVPYPVGTTLVLTELVAGTGICGLIAVAGAIQFFGDSAGRILLGVLVCAVAGVAALTGMRIWLRRSGAKSRLRRFVGEIDVALRRIAPAAALRYGIVMLAIQVLSGALLVAMLVFLGVRVSVWQAVVANSTAFFLGAISMVPMGLGVNELTMLFCLKAFGVPGEAAVTAIAMQRLLTTGLTYLLGLLAGGLLGIHDARTQKPADADAEAPTPAAEP